MDVNELISKSDRTVQIKHLCVPSLQILLSDLVFMDFFMCRDERGPNDTQCALRTLSTDPRLKAHAGILEARLGGGTGSDGLADQLLEQLRHGRRPERLQVLALRIDRLQMSHPAPAATGNDGPLAPYQHDQFRQGFQQGFGHGARS